MFARGQGRKEIVALENETEVGQAKLFALVNIRYLWETGARLKTEGQTLVVTATFPVPSVRLK